MSLLVAAVIGILVGLALGGRLKNLGRLPLRWNALVFAALALQVVTFTPLNFLPWDLVPALYLLSNSLAAAWVLRNLRVAGMPLISLGALSNLLAIAVNGGRMPVDRLLLARTRGQAFADAVAAGRMPTNAVISDSHTRLIWLTDRLVLPPPLPAPVVWSVGDLLIAAGVIWLIAAGMRHEQVRSAQKSAA